MRESAVSVLHVHSGNLFGGVERIMETLAGYRAGRAAMTTAFALCFEGRLSSTLREAGAVVHELGPTRARRPGEVLRARRRLKEALDAGRYDVAMVHSAWSQAIFGGTIAAAQVPLVRWFHAPDRGPGWMEYWAGRTRPALALYNSRYTLDGARGRMNGVRSEVHFPLARPVDALDAGDRAATRAALGTSAETAVVAMVSRLEPLKGHHLLIEALAKLPRTGWEAWIVGGAQRPEESRYLAEVRQAIAAAQLDDHVRLLGERADVGRLLHAADIYCQPNAGPEAFGLSFVEALGAGLPVVTTLLGAAPEIVDARCGVLIEPASTVALATALSSLVTDEPLRRRLGQGARRRAAELSDLPSAFDRLASSVRSVRRQSLDLQS